MGLFDKFFGVSTSSENHLPELYPLSIEQTVFVVADLITTYQKILTDVFERTHGISEADRNALWDNCLQSEAPLGLVSLLAEAMATKKTLFLVYKNNVIRKADQNEQEKIKTDYAKSGKSELGVYVSFEKYRRTDMLLLYSGFEYCTLGSLNKVVNLSKAVQIKVSKLRATVSLHDASAAADQAKAIAVALEAGKGVMMDADDAIETATPDIGPTEKAIAFLDAKRAWYLGLPLAYITGEQTSGIGSTGENDMRAVERGLQQYFVSIVKPVSDALFGVKVEFRSQDFRQIQAAIELGKGLELVSENVLSLATRQKLMAVAFNVDAAQELKQIQLEERARPATPQVTAVVNQQQGNG